MTSNMRKKAVCIGVRYSRDGIDYHLEGAQNDALRMADTLRDNYGYQVKLLLDRESYPWQPTRDGIKAAIAWLVEDAQAGDRLFFHFSGHGDQIPNLDNTEEDGKDEVILPSDWKIDPNHDYLDDRERYPVEGRILDDELNEWLVTPIPPGCYLNALFDNCHSGTALDLKYRRYCGSPEQDHVDSPINIIYEEPSSFESPIEQTTSRIGSGHSNRQRSLIEGAMEITYAVVPKPLRSNSRRKFSVPRGRLIVRGESKDATLLGIQGGNVYSWCACSDEQLAGETTVSGKASGYMVDAFLTCLKEHPDPPPTYEQLLLALNGRLRDVCRAYNSQTGRLPSEIVRQDPEFGSHLLPDMKATIVI